MMTISLMKARYRKTIAGFIWVLLNPIIMFGAQSMAFKNFLKLDVPNYHLFLTSNLIPWIFIISNLQMCTTIFDDKKGILKSYQVNPLIFLVSQILDNFFNFICTFIILLIPLMFYSNSFSAGFFHLIIALPLLLISSFLISGIFAFLQVFFKDIKFIVQFITSVIFFITPVFYPVSYVPDRYRFLIDYNIFYIVIRPINICLYEFNLNNFWNSILVELVAITFLGVLSYWVWRKKRNEFYLFL